MLRLVLQRPAHRRVELGDAPGGPLPLRRAEPCGVRHRQQRRDLGPAAAVEFVPPAPGELRQLLSAAEGGADQQRRAAAGRAEFATGDRDDVRGARERQFGRPLNGVDEDDSVRRAPAERLRQGVDLLDGAEFALDLMEGEEVARGELFL